MKRNLLFWFSTALMAASPAVLSGCSEEAPTSVDDNSRVVNNTNFSAEATFSRDMDGSTVTALKLDGINGTISVIGDPASSAVKVSGTRRVRSSSTQDAQAHLNQLLVDIQALGEEIRVKTLQPQLTGGRQYLVDYTISVPSSMNTVIRSLNGRVGLDGTLSQTSVNLTNGDIQSTITLSLDGVVDLSIVNGNIDLDVPSGTSAQFSAVVGNGSIHVSGLDLQNPTQTVRSLRGQFGEGRGSIILSAANGNITVGGL